MCISLPVQKPQHQCGDNQSGQDCQPDFNSQHFHELEQRSRPDGFSDNDGNSRLVKVRSNEVHYLFPFACHGHSSHCDVDFSLDQITDDSGPGTIGIFASISLAVILNKKEQLPRLRYCTIRFPLMKKSKLTYCQSAKWLRSQRTSFSTFLQSCPSSNLATLVALQNPSGPFLANLIRRRPMEWWVQFQFERIYG